MPSPSVSTHALESGIVLSELRVLYVPVPKAASTTILWTLARLAGLEAAAFERSTKLEVTRELAVHDLSIWGSEHVLAGRSDAEVEEILRSERWFRFTVVREPTRRLWSAWVSKLLVRDPRFVATYGQEDWFPARARSSGDVVAAFRRFVRVLPARAPEWHDPHWAPQAEQASIGDVTYSHVGRAERLDETFSALADAVEIPGAIDPPPRANESPLPFAPELFDSATLEASDALAAPDRDAFGFERPTAAGDEPPPQWHARVDASLGAIGALTDRNDRIGDLKRLLEESRRQRRGLRGRAARRS
jgi:hypothetical protein